MSCGGLGYAKELFKFRCTSLIEPGTSVLYGLKYLFHVRVLVYKNVLNKSLKEMFVTHLRMKEKIERTTDHQEEETIWLAPIYFEVEGHLTANQSRAKS